MKGEKHVPEATRKKIENAKFLHGRTSYIFDYALETWYERMKDMVRF